MDVVVLEIKWVKTSKCESLSPFSADKLYDCLVLLSYWKFSFIGIHQYQSWNHVFLEIVKEILWCVDLPGLPVCPELTREHIPKTRDVGHFLSVTGTVIRTSLVKVLEFERDYMCNKCKHVFVVKADFEQYYAFCRPSTCPNEEGCNSSKFSCLSGTTHAPNSCRDYQEIKIQEQVLKLFKLIQFICWTLICWND